jgi:hypothetical protein
METLMTTARHPPTQSVSDRQSCRYVFLAACILLFALVPAATHRPVLAQDEVEVHPPQEYMVKAVFLYTFGRFIEWPPNTYPNKDAPFVIGVLGKNPFGESLDRIAKIRKIDGRPIKISYFQSLVEYRPCQILFVPKTTPPEEQTIVIKRLENQPVLLVGEEANFTRQGGTLNFFLEQDSIRFELNAETVKRQHLSIDAKMLQLASLVRGEGEKRN